MLSGAQDLLVPHPDYSIRNVDPPEKNRLPIFFFNYDNDNENCCLLHFLMSRIFRNSRTPLVKKKKISSNFLMQLRIVSGIRKLFLEIVFVVCLCALHITLSSLTNEKLNAV